MRIINLKKIIFGEPDPLVGKIYLEIANTFNHLWIMVNLYYHINWIEALVHVTHNRISFMKEMGI